MLYANEQKGVDERKNHTLLEITRGILEKFRIK